jgi:hypothetical protein
MNALSSGTRRRWAWAAAGAALGAVALVAFFGASVRHLSAPASVVVRQKPAIELAERRKKSALDDEATLLDPTPLFQPTEWNATQMTVLRPEPSGSFQNLRVPPKFRFADSEFRLGGGEPAEAAGKAAGSMKLGTSLDLPDPVAMPARLPELLSADRPGTITVGIGRSEESAFHLPVRGALVDVVALSTGHSGLPPQAMAQLQTMAAGAKPPAGRPWQALEFVAAVDAAGLAAPLTLTTRSGVDEVDAYFQNFLAQTLRIGERLAPGFYRISVGP